MRLYLKTKDYFKTNEEFELLHDPELDLLQTNPQPKSLDFYYQSDDYISHTDAKNDLVSKLYQMVKSYSLKRKVKLINSYSLKRDSLLDVGAGTADFLISAKKDGWQASGVEPNHQARKLALEKGQRLAKSVDQLELSEYDVITLWHVLEHLPDLNAQITKFAKLLAKGGVLVIAVPNFKSFDAQHYGEFWAAYDVPRHLWHFSRDAIKTLFERSGFKLVATKPMFFDAFYVALLSEKYKKNSFSLIKGFLIGFASNLKALFTGEYSSLIYILAKNED